MQTVILDDSLRTRLHDLKELLEVRDESGAVVGHFLPVDRPTGLLEALRQCPYTEEELEEFGKASGGRTLPEIWQTLGRT